MSSRWKLLESHHAKVDGRSILSLFDKGDRAARYTARLGDLVFDFSKTNIDDDGMELLVALAEGADVAGRREAMFSGVPINETEGRAVLHTALRNLDGTVVVGGVDVMPEVRATYARMAAFADAVRSGTFQGQGGRITDVVNIGIGGSDLGPAMAAIALSPYADGPRTHIVSNVDGAQIAETLA